jgi:hypothetical protein
MLDQFKSLQAALTIHVDLPSAPTALFMLSKQDAVAMGHVTPFDIFGGKLCYGSTGAITRIFDGQKKRIVTGLDSFAHEDGDYAYGPHDISFKGKATADVVLGGCFLQVSGIGSCGKLIRVKSNGSWQPIANFGAFEASHPTSINNFGQSNPFAVLALPNMRIVVNAAGNDVLSLINSQISQIAVFPQRMVKDPSAPGLLAAMDVVPTSVAVGPDGALYVSELTGYPFPIAGAQIYRISPGKEPEIFAKEFTNVIDIVFDREGNLLVLEIAKNSLRSDDLTGALIQLKPDGSRKTLITKGLVAPTAVTIGNDNAFYISNCGLCAHRGQVIRIQQH